MQLLLDTCVLLWMVGDPDRLSTPAREVIARADSSLLVSAISAFEIAVKRSKGKLELPLPPREWVARALADYGISAVPMTSEMAALAPEVAVAHRDPCDRIILATAQILGIPIVTPDPLIRDCPDATVIW